MQRNSNDTVLFSFDMKEPHYIEWGTLQSFDNTENEQFIKLDSEE